MISRAILVVKKDWLWWIPISLAILLSLGDGYLQLLYKGNEVNIQKPASGVLGLICLLMMAYEMVMRHKKPPMELSGACIAVIAIVGWIWVFPW